MAKYVKVKLKANDYMRSIESEGINFKRQIENEPKLQGFKYFSVDNDTKNIFKIGKEIAEGRSVYSMYEIGSALDNKLESMPLSEFKNKFTKKVLYSLSDLNPNCFGLELQSSKFTNYKDQRECKNKLHLQLGIRNFSFHHACKTVGENDIYDETFDGYYKITSRIEMVFLYKGTLDQLIDEVIRKTDAMLDTKTYEEITPMLFR